MEAKVHQISIQKSSGYNLIGVGEWKQMPTSEQVKLICASKVQFLTVDGDSIPARQALEWIKANA